MLYNLHLWDYRKTFLSQLEYCCLGLTWIWCNLSTVGYNDTAKKIVLQAEFGLVFLSVNYWGFFKGK